MEQPRRPNASLARAARLTRLSPWAAAFALPAALAQIAPQNPLIVPPAERDQRPPLTIGASQTFTRDTNIFRAQDGLPETGDTVSTTTLFGGIDQPFGRQRVTADAAVSHNKFNNQDQLDHTGYRLGVGLDWETIERLSGNVSFVAQQRLARFGLEGQAPSTQRNLERARQFNASVQYGGPAVLAIYGLFDHRAVDFSLATASFDRLDYERNMFGIGARYRVGGALVVGAEARAGKGKFPHFRLDNGPVTGDDFDRREIALTAQWQPTGASRVAARLGATKEDHDVVTRDFSGATGSLLWDWRPTGKLRFETELRRDTGQEIDPLRIAGVVDAVGDSSFTANRVQLRAFYEATAKIRLDGLLRYTRRSLFDTTILASAPSTPFSSAGSDNTTTLQLAARWDPTRTIGLGCSIGHENRNADVNAGIAFAPSFDYKANTFGCFAQIALNP